MTSSQVRNLRGVIEREGAAIGVFVTLELATKDMRKEAADAGIWQTKTVHGTKHPRLQILTIEDLLAGKRIVMPAQQENPLVQSGAQGQGEEERRAKLF